MTVIDLRLLVLLAYLALAACKPAAEVKTPEAAPAPSTAPAAAPPAPVTFSHDPKLDAQGVYRPNAVVQTGNLKLASLDIGQADDFADWEAGKRPAAYAPIFMAFDDVASPTAKDGLGRAYHTVSIRVMPTAYRVDAQEVSFHGVDPNLGQVTFTGVFDLGAPKAAKAAKAQGPGRPKPVLTGVLQVGDRQFGNIVFQDVGGD